MNNQRRGISKYVIGNHCPGMTSSCLWATVFGCYNTIKLINGLRRHYFSLGSMFSLRILPSGMGFHLPPAFFKIVPETMFVSGGVEHITAGGPPLGCGQSARVVTASSDSH